MSDAETIERILSGDDRLFTQLVVRYTGYVWALCSSYVRNPSDCEDLTQEVFVQCYQRLGTLRNPAAFGPWLGQVTRRQCLMWLRSTTRREHRLARYEREADTLRGPHHGRADAVAGEERMEGLRDAVDELPADYREALLLRYSEGYSVEEAAAFLGVSPAAMRKRLERAKAMLKDRLWEHVEPALAKRKLSKELVPAIVAAIPFGRAPWLASTGGMGVTVAGTSTGGTIIMLSKIAIAFSLVLVGLGLAIQPAESPKITSATPASLPARNQSDQSALADRSDQSTEAERPVAEVLVAAAAAEPAAPAPATAPVAPAPAPASVSGCITDNRGQPLAGASVRLEIGRDRYVSDVAKTYDTKTSANGTYEIQGIDTFGHAYVFPASDGFLMDRVSVEVKSGAPSRNINAALEPARFVIAGHVVSEDGSPVAGASVDILYYGYNMVGLARTGLTGRTTGTISNAKFGFALSDQSGAFALPIPSEGLCDLRVLKAGYGVGFFPKLATGTTDADLVLHPPASIAGRVTTGDGKPAAGMEVCVEGKVKPGGLGFTLSGVQRLLAPPVRVVTDDHGRYRVDGLGEAYAYDVTVPVLQAGSASAEPDPIRGIVAEQTAELVQSSFGGAAALAREEAIGVSDGETVDGVDLVVGKERAAIVRGKITDRTTGALVCPVVVTAGSGSYENWFQAKLGGGALTQADGTYELRIDNLARATEFKIGHFYSTEGGSAWEQPEEIAATLTLGPGQQETLDFAVDAPLVVPVRYVNPQGAPIEGIEAALGRAGGHGGCGGALISGRDGRVTFHGVRPGPRLQAMAWQKVGDDLRTLGRSEPFSGTPGQTMPEVLVTCRLLGGVQVVLVYPDGRPAANTTVMCISRLAETNEPFTGQATTDDAGAFGALEAIPEGRYPVARLELVDPQSNQGYTGTIQDVVISPGAVTDLGTITVQPNDTPILLVTFADSGRKDNARIAAAYDPSWLDIIDDTRLLLKTGFALYDEERYEEALAVFERMQEVAADSPVYEGTSAIWQGHMLDLLGRRNEALAAYQRAVDLDVQDSMQHDQYGLAYAPSQYAKERMKTPFERVENKD